MTHISPPYLTTQGTRLAMLFPNADAQIVSALSGHAQALTCYLAQIHELTLAETIEAVEAFFNDTATDIPQANVA